MSYMVTAYEMRIRQRGSSKKESTFKASKESKKPEVILKNHSENSDDAESLLIKKLKRGTSKYKGKLPLKCFNCGKIGHFASKFFHPKPDDSNDEETSKKSKKKKVGNKNFYNKNKIFYYMEDSEDEDTSEDEET